MRAIIFGATGMVGQSVLRECLVDDTIQQVLTIGRNNPHNDHRKLKKVEIEDVTDLSAITTEITGFDVCFFCLGVSSAGMKEADYRKITYDMTIAVATTLAKLNPQMSFFYVSGSGTDSSEQGRSMWARVKGKTENDLLRLSFQSAYMIRPGGILPSNGVRSKTRLYQIFYDIMKPFYPLIKKLSMVITSEQLGKAMIQVAKTGYSSSIIESRELKKIGSGNM